jgi:hypothetical protein
MREVTDSLVALQGISRSITVYFQGIPEFFVFLISTTMCPFYDVSKEESHALFEPLRHSSH